MTAGRSQTLLRRVATLLTGLVAGMLTLPAVAQAQPTGPTQLGVTDMALLNGVRLAGLWEIPAGQMAAEKGNSPRVREIGAEIAKQHIELDQLAVQAANKMGASLPTEPTTEQKKWLAEMQEATGPRFDKIFVDRLRAAHGAIFPVIGAVRANTRSEAVRKLAQEANSFVMDHLTMLESTGLVRYDELPPVAMPGPPNGSVLAVAQANGAPGIGSNGLVMWVVLLVALGMGTAVTFRVLRRG
jgi:predicted outer membrane protein